MEAPRLSYFAMIFVLLLTIIGFIFVVFNLNGAAFAFELVLLLAFMFLLAFAMFFLYHRRKGSWGILGSVLVMMVFDTLAIAFFRGEFSTSYALTILFAIIGLIVVISGYLAAPKETEEEWEQYDKAKYYYPLVDKNEPDAREEMKQEAKSDLKKEQKVTATYSPGKYIASKKANKFHSPKCDWAQRIGVDNQVWFNSKEEAEAKGFEADKCVG